MDFAKADSLRDRLGRWAVGIVQSAALVNGNASICIFDRFKSRKAAEVYLRELKTSGHHDEAEVFDLLMCISTFELPQYLPTRPSSVYAPDSYRAWLKLSRPEDYSLFCQ